MESKIIHCSKHPKETINRINTNPDDTKLLYCFECVLENEDRKTLSSTLVNIQSFIDMASQFYSSRRDQLRTTTSGPPSMYVEMLSTRAETLDSMTKHINQEKDKINILFDDLLNGVINMVNKARQEHLTKLDEQLRIVCHHFNFFERQLRRSFPRDEDIDAIAPSREQLEARLSALSTTEQLHAFVEEIKDDMHQSRLEKDQRHGERTSYWDTMVQNLKEAECARPFYKMAGEEEGEVNKVKEKIQTALDDSLREFTSLQGALHNNLFDSYPNSDFVLESHFEMIRRWLPKKYEFSPKLIYKSTKHGKNFPKYHSLCDKKGPTITIIKCRFQGSSKVSLIGGFLDIDISKDGGYRASTEAFIFSLTRNVKCPILKEHTQYATYGQEICGPVFGTMLGNDILVYDNCTCKPSCYKDSAKIVEIDGYNGVDQVNFTYDDFEVYKLH